MNVRRNTSRLFSRRSTRLSGCAPLLVLLLVTVGVVIGGRHWIGQRLSPNRVAGPIASLSEAFAAFNRGDLQTAIKYARQVIERDGADSAAYQMLVRALIYRSYSDFGREQDRQAAVEISREALAKLPRDLDIQALYAFALQAAESAEEAGRIALRIVEREPDNTLARTVLSLSYGARGIGEAALREAEAALERSKEQNKHELEAHRALALAQGYSGDYRSAQLQLEKAIGNNDKLIFLYFEKALYASQLGDIDKATVAYYTIMALDDDNVKVRARLCELLERMQQRESALRYCQEVTDLAPLRAEGWFELGRLHFLHGDYAEAQSAFAQCSRLQVEGGIAIGDRQLECWYLQGQSAEILGDCDALTLVYWEFEEMVREAGLPQTWSYPPGGPPTCARSAPNTRPTASP